MLLARQDKTDRLVGRVDQEQKSFVAGRVALEREHVDRVAAEKHADTTHERRAPFLVAHLVAAGIEPHYVPDFRAADPAALEEFWAPKNRMIAPELNESLRKIEEFVLRVVVFP